MSEQQTTENQTEETPEITTPENQTEETTDKELFNPFTKKKLEDENSENQEETEAKNNNKETGIKTPTTHEQDKTVLSQKNEAIKKAKQEKLEYKRKYQSLQKEIEKAKQEKDEVSQKLLEREQQQLYTQMRQQSRQEWDLQASTNFDNDNDFEYYKNATEFYGREFVKRPAIEQAVNLCKNPHKVLNALYKFMDSNNIPLSRLTDKNQMNDRQLVIFFKQVETELDTVPATQQSKTQTQETQPVKPPKPIIATTTTEIAPGKLGEQATREQFLKHYSKYGKAGF